MAKQLELAQVSALTACRAPRWHSAYGPSSEFTHGIDRSQIRRHVDGLDRAHPRRSPSASPSGRAPATQMIVVPSAMSGETNRLLGLGERAGTSKPAEAHNRELDMLAATGEQASSALAGASRCRPKAWRP